MVPIETQITCKLATEELTISSPWADIERIPNNTVTPIRCIAAAARLITDNALIERLREIDANGGL